MASNDPEHSPPATVPDAILRGAVADDQLRAAARSWGQLPRLTKDRMLARAHKLLSDGEISTSPPTEPEMSQANTARLKREITASGRHAHATARLPVETTASGRSRLSSLRNAVRPVQDRQKRRAGLQRLAASLLIIAVIVGIGYWLTLPPPLPFPEALMQRTEILLHAAMTQRGSDIRRLSAGGTEGATRTWAQQVRKLVPASVKQSEALPLSGYRELGTVDTDPPLTRVRVDIPVDHTAHPQLPRKWPLTFVWLQQNERGWVLDGAATLAELETALAAATPAAP